jgi:predicted GNAT family acetyltransferase
LLRREGQVEEVEDSRSARDRELDETLEETFPASDAPANTVETGIRVGPAPPLPAVTDNREASRFEIVVDGQTAVLTYQRTPTSVVLVHTEVPPGLRGRHLADALAKAAIDAAHAERLQIVAVCSFVKAYLRKHADRDNAREKNAGDELS